MPFDDPEAWATAKEPLVKPAEVGPALNFFGKLLLVWRGVAHPCGFRHASR